MNACCWCQRLLDAGLRKLHTTTITRHGQLQQPRPPIHPTDATSTSNSSTSHKQKTQTQKTQTGSLRLQRKTYKSQLHLPISIHIPWTNAYGHQSCSWIEKRHEPSLNASCKSLPGILNCELNLFLQNLVGTDQSWESLTFQIGQNP